jgi:hypothetical protein
VPASGDIHYPNTPHRSTQKQVPRKRCTGAIHLGNVILNVVKNLVIATAMLVLTVTVTHTPARCFDFAIATLNMTLVWCPYPFRPATRGHHSPPLRVAQDTQFTRNFSCAIHGEANSRATFIAQFTKGDSLSIHADRHAPPPYYIHRRQKGCGIRRHPS